MQANKYAYVQVIKQEIICYLIILLSHFIYSFGFLCHLRRQNKFYFPTKF